MHRAWEPCIWGGEGGRCWQPTFTSHVGRGRRKNAIKGGKKGGKATTSAKEWAVISCPHCLTNAAGAITIASGEMVWCPGCKKQYRTSASNPRLVVSRHPSLTEAEQALKVLSKR
jgi:hypothetical protein